LGFRGRGTPLLGHDPCALLLGVCLLPFGPFVLVGRAEPLLVGCQQPPSFQGASSSSDLNVCRKRRSAAE
jgi:hypothetical protein